MRALAYYEQCDDSAVAGCDAAPPCERLKPAIECFSTRGLERHRWRHGRRRDLLLRTRSIDPAPVRPVNIVTLCTGNVARSVMLGYMLTTLAEGSGEAWMVRTAGTHVIEGSAMSGRTRDALLAIDELEGHHYNAHRSHQLNAQDVAWADVILATEAAHVRFVRSNFDSVGRKTVQLHQFVQYAPLDAPFGEQLAVLENLEPSEEFDVDDPAGGDQEVYNRCALQLWELAQVFALLVGVDAG